MPSADAVRATDVRAEDERITVNLANGAIISVPTNWSSRLMNATPEQRAGAIISDDGESLHWAEIDEDIGVAHLLGIPEDIASVANGATIYPPLWDSDVAEHVSALVLTLLRAEAAALRAAGATAQAVYIRRGASMMVALAFEASDSEPARTLVVGLYGAGRLAEVDVRITDDEQLVIAQIGRATVDPPDLAPVALSFARAGSARLRLGHRSGTTEPMGDTSTHEPEPRE